MAEITLISGSTLGSAEYVSEHLAEKLDDAGFSSEMLHGPMLDEVTEAYYTTGHYSIFIKVMCRSIDALQHVLINKIQTIDEIQSTETLIVLQNPIMRTIRP